MHIAQNLSVWMIAPLLAVVLMAAHVLGAQVRQFLLRRKVPGALDAEEDFREYLRAALSLMSLLIAFAFGASLERYNLRRNLVQREALAISAYYRDLLELREPQRTQLTGGLVHYLKAREAYSGVSERELARAALASEAAGQQLWLGVASVAREGGAPEGRTALSGAEEVLQAAAARRDALAARVPARIVRALLLYAVVAAAFLGYAAKPGQVRVVAPAIQLSLLALAISLVLDLDSARGGGIRVDQTPLTSIVERIRQYEALRRVAPPEPWLASKPCLEERLCNPSAGSKTRNGGRAP